MIAGIIGGTVLLGLWSFVGVSHTDISEQDCSFG
jgi:hypothetical protein